MLDAETELERQLLDDPALRAGLDWGQPRSGHPEGRVATRMQAEGEVMALAGHPVFAEARPVEARIFHIVELTLPNADPNPRR